MYVCMKRERERERRGENGGERMREGLKESIPKNCPPKKQNQNQILVINFMESIFSFLQVSVFRPQRKFILLLFTFQD